MKNRPIEIAGFLTQHGWGGADAEPLEGDLSTRRYARLEKKDGQRAILMDAGLDQKTDAFLKIAKLLKSVSLSAPQIFAADGNRGLVLMEDFGSKNLGRLLDDGHEASPLFHASLDALSHLHRHFDSAEAHGSHLPLFDKSLFAEQVDLYLDFYLPFSKGQDATAAQRDDFKAAWLSVLTPLDAFPRSLMLRDFMPDNLMLLDGRDGPKAIGLLDFQDAGLGPIAYDIASLCENVRRDGGKDLLDEVMAAYLAITPCHIPLPDLKRACRTLAAQRHTRILGLIARHAAKTGETARLSYLPRVIHYLTDLLDDENLKPVRLFIEAVAAM